jgi:hypothetical protein
MYLVAGAAARAEIAAIATTAFVSGRAIGRAMPMATRRSRRSKSAGAGAHDRLHRDLIVHCLARSGCGTIVGQRPAGMRMRDSTGTRVTLLNSFRSGSTGFNDRHCRNCLKLQITAFVRRRRTMIVG